MHDAIGLPQVGRFDAVIASGGVPDHESSSAPIQCQTAPSHCAYGCRAAGGEHTRDNLGRGHMTGEDFDKLLSPLRSARLIGQGPQSGIGRREDRIGAGVRQRAVNARLAHQRGKLREGIGRLGKLINVSGTCSQRNGRQDQRKHDSAHRHLHCLTR